MTIVAERFGSYTVYECLGPGRMATVHRASIAIGVGVVREVALKIVELGNTAGTYFIAMELVRD